MTKPTEGPFYLLEGQEEISVMDSKRNCLACFWVNDLTYEEALANARLFMGAPKLLSIVLRFIALAGGAWHPDRHAADEMESMQQARAALKEATGE